MAYFFAIYQVISSCQHQKWKKLRIMNHDLFESMRIAIIDDNILAGIGLQHMLEDMIPMAEVILCQNTDEIKSVEGLQQFAHYFVSSHIYFANIDLFRIYAKKTIILVNGDNIIKGMRTLNVCQNEKKLTHDFIALHRIGHGEEKSHERQASPLLSPREIQVVILLCKGYINKEIGKKLNISLATVMTHRKNIIAKLHAKSLADIIIYAVVNGYVNIEELL